MSSNENNVNTRIYISSITEPLRKRRHRLACRPIELRRYPELTYEKLSAKRQTEGPRKVQTRA